LFTSRKATLAGASLRAPARPGVVSDPGMYGRSLRGNREISGSGIGAVVAGWSVAGRQEPKPLMHDPEKSDSDMVAMKPMNKAWRLVAELAEPRPGTKGNADQQSTHRTQSRDRVTQALARVREAARHRKKEQSQDEVGR